MGVLLSRRVPTITWTQQSNPADVPHLMHFTNLLYDPVSQRIISYLVPNDGANIYASSMHTYDPSANEWEYLGGSASVGNTCSAPGSPSPWPGNRHPVGNFAIDTLRNRLWLANGVCANNDRDDFWYYALNADPTANTWTLVDEEGTLDLPTYSLMVYVDTYDLLFVFGMHGNGNGQSYIYAPSASVNANQIAAGATSAQTWISTAGPGAAPSLPAYNRAWLNSMFWDAAFGKVVLFTKDETTGAREIWLYDVLTQTWSKRSAAVNQPSDTASLSTGDKDHVRITAGRYAGEYYFHRSTRTLNCDGAATGFLYNVATNTYRAVEMLGTPPRCAVHLGFAHNSQHVVGWSGASGDPVVSVGVWS